MNISGRLRNALEREGDNARIALVGTSLGIIDEGDGEEQACQKRGEGYKELHYYLPRFFPLNLDRKIWTKQYAKPNGKPC